MYNRFDCLVLPLGIFITFVVILFTAFCFKLALYKSQCIMMLKYGVPDCMVYLKWLNGNMLLP